MGEWRTMESAPVDALIDVWNGHGRIVDAYWGRPDDEPKDARAWVQDRYERNWGLVSYRIKPEPTHWMPLPPPPAPMTLRETVDAIRA